MDLFAVKTIFAVALTTISLSSTSEAATTTDGDKKFTCIDLLANFKTRWAGNIEYQISHPKFVSQFTEWRIELHFDQYLTKLEQWLGDVDDSVEIIHEEGRVFIIKNSVGSMSSSLSGPLQSDIIATYNGAVEPRVQQAVLCGITDADAVYQTRLKPVELVPAMFDSNAAIPQCSLIMNSNWDGNYQETIAFPVKNVTTNGWFVELKFDRKWTQIQQWSCDSLSSDGTHFVCRNLSYNGRQDAGSTFSIKYQVSYQQTTQPAPKLLEAWFNNYHCTTQ